MDMEKSLAALVERASVAEKVVNSLQSERSEKNASRKRKLNSALDSVAERRREVEVLRESLEKRERDLEEKEKEFLAFQESKKREFAYEEQRLSSKKEKAGKKLKMIEDKVERLRLDQESLLEKEKMVNVVIVTLDGRITAVEEKEEEFDLFKEGKMREIALEEEKLKKKWEEFADHVREREKWSHRFMERIELAEKNLDVMRVNIDERFEEIELRDVAGWESLALSAKNADLIRESVEKKMKEFEKMKTEFIAFQEKKMGEMALKEQQLAVMGEELVKDTMLRNEQLIEREKLGHQLLEKLELARNDVEGLKTRVRERYVKIVLIETELESVRDWVQKKIAETDLKAEEFEEREKRIAEREDHLISKENELKGKENTLLAWHKGLEEKHKELEDKQKEVDLVRKSSEQQKEKLDAREKSLNSLKEFTRNCFKEHRSIKRKLATERDLVQQSAIDLAQRAEHLKHAQKDLELREKQITDAHKELKLKEQRSTNVFNASSRIESDESGAEIKLMLRMDGKTLQMFLNDTEKDLESMCDEIFKVLPLSSDPAKLVLDSMVGFYPPHLRAEDVELNVRRTCIVLLGQLIKMSPIIKPYVKEEAIQVATTWKLKMGATCKNAKPVEVLGFLLLLSAFDLTSYFDGHEIYRFLMMLDHQHRNT